MHAIVKPWLDLWDYLDGNFWSVCNWAEAALGPEQLAWQPNPRVASIGWNLQHLAEMLDHYLTHVFAQGGPRQGAPLATMVPGSLDRGVYRDIAAITAYHRQVRPAYRHFLLGLSASDFERSLGGGSRWTWSWAIGHIAEHESYHLGKCMLLRNLIHAPKESD